MAGSRHTAVACLALGILAACSTDQPSPVAPDAAALRPTRSGGVVVDRGRLTVPSSAVLTDQAFANAARRAIDPGNYQCPGLTPLFNWYVAQAVEIITKEPAVFTTLYVDLSADQIPTYEALYFQTRDTPQYFGYTGEFTNVILKTEKDVKRFWDISSADIQVVGMHGTMLLDAQRVARTYEAVFGLPSEVAAAVAAVVRSTMLQSQTVNGGNHPLFSFNAYAFTTFGGSVPDKIVIGDGVLEGYKVLGFGDVAPQALFAHEFGHHIQFENGYLGDAGATAGSAPEQARYIELMADALGAYFLTHKRGAAMNQKRVEQFLRVYYQTGDCGFDSDGHHGTPNQRMAAARFGFRLADQAQKQGHILTSAEIHALFVAEYPTLVAPDAF
jgi:hypothetical protein